MKLYVVKVKNRPGMYLDGTGLEVRGLKKAAKFFSLKVAEAETRKCQGYEVIELPKKN